MPIVAWLIFLLSAILEVAGDALIRHGLRSRALAFIALGFVSLSSYGLIVNTVPWNFSKLLGVYVAIFAIVSILAGRFVFNETIPPTTWLGLAVITLGGLIIQFSHS